MWNWVLRREEHGQEAADTLWATGDAVTPTRQKIARFPIQSQREPEVLTQKVAPLIQDRWNSEGVFPAPFEARTLFQKAA